MIWLVYWQHYDQSGGAFVKAFQDEAKAKELHAMMVKHADGKEWYCEQVPFENDYGDE